MGDSESRDTAAGAVEAELVSFFGLAVFPT